MKKYAAMRALLAISLGCTGACDVWWASFIGASPRSADGGVTEPVDLAMAPDLPFVGCEALGCGKHFSGSCDLNTGECVPVLMIEEDVFPDNANFATSMPLTKRYTLLASGDFNGDQVTDVAVSGLFSSLSGGASADLAGVANVDIYLGNGSGGLTFDGSCAVNDKITHLLTIPGDGTVNNAAELLVATQGFKIYHCKRASSGAWNIDSSTLPSGLNGFKQLALAYDPGVTFPDLMVRTSKNLFPDSTGSGSLDGHRMNPGYQFTGESTSVSTADVSWVTVTPYHFGTPADTLAMSWGNKAPIYFRYLDGNLMIREQGPTGTPASGGMPFAELTTPLRTTALFRITSQAPSLASVVSQSANWVSMMSGTSAARFAVVSSMMVPVSGIMLAYAGDANEDGKDELGLYTLAPNPTAMERHLQIYSYDVGFANPALITDLVFANENVRGMAFGYLGNAADRRTRFKRKDLIALVEDPSGFSRIVIHRANLNLDVP